MSEKATTKRKKNIERKIEIISRGVYQNGKIKLMDKGLPKRKMNVIVTFKEEKPDLKNNKVKQANDFLKKWSGVIKTKDLDSIMDEKINYLVEKHK